MPAEPSDLARELVRRQKAELQNEAQRAKQIRALVNIEVAALIGEGWARRAWLIGSLAWGNFGVRSDVDLVLDGLKFDRMGAAAARVASQVNTGVDILRLEDLPETFRQRIFAEGIALVA